MALIKCKECGEGISNKADSCPHCGYSLDKARKDADQLFQVLLGLTILACFIGYLWYKGFLPLNK